MLIPQVLKQTNLDFTDDAIGIVFPIYAGRAPKIVLDFLRKSKFNTDYLYFIGTYGNHDSAICETVNVIPAINQVELHPFFVQEKALETMMEYGVTPMAWGPLAEGKHGIFTHPVLSKIGEKYGKTPAQAALRWNTQRGVVIIPKSTHIERIEQNINIWDFELTADEMEEISKLDLGRSEIVDHSDPAFIKMIHSLKVHE